MKKSGEFKGAYCFPVGLPVVEGPSAGATGRSGYSNFTPGSQSKLGQQSGNGAVLFTLSDNLHFGLAFGSGPQSSTNSNRVLSSPSAFTQVDRPQNGVNSHVCPTSIVEHRVDAKHTVGKSRSTSAGISRLYVFGWSTAGLAGDFWSAA